MEVPTSRASWTWTPTGESSGRGEITFTFDDRGMVLALERSTSTTAPSVLGRVTHEETARFALQSRTPRS